MPERVGSGHEIQERYNPSFTCGQTDILKTLAVTAPWPIFFFFSDISHLHFESPETRIHTSRRPALKSENNSALSYYSLGPLPSLRGELSGKSLCLPLSLFRLQQVSPASAQEKDVFSVTQSRFHYKKSRYTQQPRLQISESLLVPLGLSL